MTQTSGGPDEPRRDEPHGDEPRHDQPPPGTTGGVPTEPQWSQQPYPPPEPEPARSPYAPPPPGATSPGMPAEPPPEQPQPYPSEAPPQAEEPWAAAPPPSHPGPYPPAAAYGAQPYQPAYPVQARKTNGLAVASLICSLAGIAIGISAPVGAVLGHLALRQIRQTGEDGEGLAKAGIIVGWIITGLILIACCVGAIAIIAASNSSNYR